MHELAKVRHNEHMYRDNERTYYAGAITSTNDAGTKKENKDLYALVETDINRVYSKGEKVVADSNAQGTQFQYFTDEQLVNHNPHAHYFSICSTGDRILDENLK